MADKNVVELKTPEQKATEYVPTFDDLWTLYPRRVAKLAARKAWARIDPTQHVAILTALTAWRQVWRDKDPEFIPHPASWLNGERWEDELPPGFTARPQARPEIGPPRDDQAVQVRQAMPEHISAVIARLKGLPKEKPA